MVNKIGSVKYVSDYLNNEMKLDRMKGANNMKELNEIARQIIAIDPWGAGDCDETPETLAAKLATDIDTCHETIKYLLTIIDDLTA